MKEKGHDVNAVWADMKSVMTDMSLSVLERFKEGGGKGQFGLYGVDFLIDDTSKVWLLEVTKGAALRMHIPHLQHLHEALFKELVALLVRWREHCDVSSKEGGEEKAVVVWDEGGHGSADPFLGNRWWDNWNRATDEITFLHRKLAFPAFSNSSADDDPGDGGPNGRQTWDDTRGYAGSVSTPGDTGFNGQLAGARNRYLRWWS